ncbi:hypothetical protein FRB97_008692 [Tulasnella sp. 331]|nr:hypothetical protein FRB97_008692 [Tulasnella sp. 331]
MASILIGVVWMKETLPNKLKAADSARTYLSNPNPDSVIAIPPKVTTGAPSPSTFSELISSSIVRRILLAIFSQNVVAMGFEVIFALFAYTPLELGGLGRNPAEIGVSLAVAAILGSILTVIAIPPLQKWTKDDVKLYTYCMCGWVLVYLIPPAMMAIGYATGGKQHSTGFVWTTMVLMLVVARACGMGWSIGQILLKNSALGPDTLGAIFGLGQMVGCIGRAIGPALTSSLFAASVGQQLLGGQLVWYIMCAISIFGAWLASRVIDAKNN